MTTNTTSINKGMNDRVHPSEFKKCSSSSSSTSIPLDDSHSADSPQSHNTAQQQSIPTANHESTSTIDTNTTTNHLMACNSSISQSGSSQECRKSQRNPTNDDDHNTPSIIPISTNYENNNDVSLESTKEIFNLGDHLKMIGVKMDKIKDKNGNKDGEVHVFTQELPTLNINTDTTTRTTTNTITETSTNNNINDSDKNSTSSSSNSVAATSISSATKDVDKSDSSIIQVMESDLNKRELEVQENLLEIDILIQCLKCLI